MAFKAVFPLLFDSGASTLFYDSFDRVDATSPGTGATGQAYTQSFTTYGISVNKLYSVNDVAGGILTADIGASNYMQTCKVNGSYAANRSVPIMVVRGIDANNYIQITPNVNGSRVDIIKVDLGAFTGLANAAFTWVDGQDYAVKVVCNGDQITVFIDGVQRVTVTLAGADSAKYGATATRMGVRYDKAGTPTVFARWDDLRAESL